ncbi:hypothetical protein GJ700_22270 [Duganella sp. FT92W]|uniref:peptidylprolyl isomerase n=2 Tax=Pseudoduganella rivuli TaxID=2666085 RepID=A0A7X2IS20_9BURK|nr:hypothetical protein [Pseudoduganella rivuli]
MLAAVALAGIALPPATAAVRYGLDDPALAARIDAAPLHAFTVDTLWRQARLADPQAARAATLEGLVAERLLAASARAQWGEAALLTGQGVAYAHDVALDDQLAALLRSLYKTELEQALAQLPGGSLDGLVVAEPAIDGAAMAATFDAVFGKPGALRLDYSLTAAQAQHAKAMPVLAYRLPGGGAGTLSLYDIYRRQNVQGRIALHMRQPGALKQQARQALGVLAVLDWAGSRFGAAALADLRRALSDQAVTLAVQRLHGIGADTDSGSPLLNQLAAQADSDAIRAYYDQHRDEFRRIDKVRARHVRTHDEAAAQAAYAALKGGADFASVARKFSMAADAAQGGDLGWIDASGKTSWLQQLAFAQPPGTVSRPVRAPVGPQDKAYWEIVLVEQRVDGVQPPEAESVRYVASRAIARRSAIAQLAALRARVVREADIELNRSLLDAPLRVLEARP